MGDGRYYTFEQFTNTFILLVIIMLMTVELVATLYKQMNNRRNKQLIVIYLLLYFGMILRFIEEVTVVSRWLLGITIIGKGIMALVVLLLGVFILRVLLDAKGTDPSSSGDIATTGNELAFVWSTFLIMCVGTFLVFAFMVEPWAGYWYLYSYGFMAYLLHLLLKMFAPYSINASVFTKAKDMILDYVFIIDIKGNLIYKNNHSERDDYFRRLKLIDTNAVELMFKQPIQHQKLNGKDYIKYTDLVTDINTYFSYSLEPLISKGKKVGGILIFTDVSGLLQLLENLNKEQTDSEMVNKELQQYAKIVYRLEKEREIHLLLDDIAQNQEISMLKLKDEMLNLQGYEGNGYAKRIRNMINMAKDNLADVRRAVSTFRAYYGGKDD